MSIKIEILAKCDPNRHGIIRLARVTEECDGAVTTVHVVALPGDIIREGDGAEFISAADARAHYEAEAARFAKIPNWEAQAAYDAEWGTDNGYAPWQSRMEG